MEKVNDNSQVGEHEEIQEIIYDSECEAEDIWKQAKDESGDRDAVEGRGPKTDDKEQLAQKIWSTLRCHPVFLHANSRK